MINFILLFKLFNNMNASLELYFIHQYERIYIYKGIKLKKLTISKSSTFKKIKSSGCGYLQKKDESEVLLLDNLISWW